MRDCVFICLPHKQRLIHDIPDQRRQSDRSGLRITFQMVKPDTRLLCKMIIVGDSVFVLMEWA